MLYQKLGQLLVDSRLITREQLQTAQQIQTAEPGRTIDEILITCGFLPASAIYQALEQKLGIPYIDLTATAIPRELTGLLSEALAKRYSVIPIRADGDTLHLAMANPLDRQALDAVRMATRRRIVPMLASREALRQAIAFLYGSLSAEKALQDLTADTASAPASSDHPIEEETAAPTIRLVNHFLEYAVSQDASDIHLEPREQEMAVRMRIDGQLQRVFTVPQSSQRAVIARVKVMGNMDVAEYRVPQDGRSQIAIGGKQMDLRISTLPTVYGEKAVIRLLHRSPSLLRPEGIGLFGENLHKFQSLLETGSGMILISGPTGSGKSATMYTMLRQLNTEQKNLITLEDPVEYNLPGINQVQINEKTGMTFASGLRSVLRQDPDIIAVGEIRDRETAEIALRAAITGHLVLSTIHTNDAVSAIDRLLDMGVERFLIAAALKGVLSQRLVRRICPNCRELYTPDISETILPQQADRVFYRGRGCVRCFHTGCRGRIGVFEILTVDQELRRAIAEGASREQILNLIHASDFQPLAKNCLELAENGTIPWAEALHTIRSAQP